MRASCTSEAHARHGRHDAVADQIVNQGRLDPAREPTFRVGQGTPRDWQAELSERPSQFTHGDGVSTQQGFLNHESASDFLSMGGVGRFGVGNFDQPVMNCVRRRRRPGGVATDSSDHASNQ